MTDYTKLGAEIGDLVTEKNAAYGSSFAKAGDFLRMLWPTGIPPGREDDALLLVRIFDKQMRIATDRDAFGESPYRDIAGYGLLGAGLHEKREAPCGSASADAEEEPKAQPASQPSSAAVPTTTSAAAPPPSSTSERCSPRRGSSSPSAESPDVSARSAMANAANGVEDHLSKQSCGQCLGPLDPMALLIHGHWFCSKTCIEAWEASSGSRAFIDLSFERSDDFPPRCGSCGNSLIGFLDTYVCVIRGRVVRLHDHCRLNFVQQLWRCDVSPSEVRL